MFLSQRDKLHIIATHDTCNACTVPVENPCSNGVLITVLCCFWRGKKGLPNMMSKIHTACHHCPSQRRAWKVAPTPSPALKQDLLSGQIFISATLDDKRFKSVQMHWKKGCKTHVESQIQGGSLCPFGLL